VREDGQSPLSRRMHTAMVVEDLWETPMPYFSAAALVAAATVVGVERGGLTRRVASTATTVTVAVVVAVEAAFPGRLWGEQVLALGLVVTMGTVFGATCSITLRAYVRWVRRVFREAEARLE
jgi:small basic protein